MGEPFASYEDVEARWRPLSESEQARATVLLDDASDMIRSRWSDVDDRVVSGALSEASLTRVVVTMVKKAMSLPAAADALQSFQQGAGPFTSGGTFRDGDLFFTAEMVRLLDGDYSRARSRNGWLA